MSYASRIIELFGGSRRMSRDLSVGGREYPPSTIQSWKDKGLIPAQHQGWVLERGRELGHEITPADFFDLPEETEPNETPPPQPTPASPASKNSQNGLKQPSKGSKTSTGIEAA